MNQLGQCIVSYVKGNEGCDLEGLIGAMYSSFGASRVSVMASLYDLMAEGVFLQTVDRRYYCMMELTPGDTLESRIDAQLAESDE